MAQQHSGRPQRRAIDDIRVTVKVTEIDEQMSELAQEVAKETLCSTAAKEKDVAAAIKKKFDDTYGPTWHCIVGRNFGSYVTHETNRFLYFFIENMAVLLFKSA